MSCKTSFTTETGTFTAYPGKVSKCEAEKLCGERGQILAPFTNKKDMSAAVAMFKYNYDNCWFSHETCHVKRHKKCNFNIGQGIRYHVGLNFKKDADGVFQKSFSNGEEWDDEKHKSLYFTAPGEEYLDECPVGVFHPGYKYVDDGSTYDVFITFAIESASVRCESQENRGYMCLKPAKQASDEPIAQGQHVSNSKKENLILLGGVFVVVLIAVVCACLFIFYPKKSKRPFIKVRFRGL